MIEAALVRAILEKWGAYDWTVQGFGMVRTKIADVGRIHIWDSRVAVPLVSTMHAHPWPLLSTIISGELINQRFEIVYDEFDERTQLSYMHSRIATGEGGGLVGDPKPVKIANASVEMYASGSRYEQRAEEIHRSIPQDGTVTLLERPQGPPLQETDVFWPAGTDWVSAEPRKAKIHEIEAAVEYALARWAA